MGFHDVTEFSGDLVSEEQITRAVSRYAWAAGYCRDGVVLDVACGTGTGLGLLAREARRLVGADITEDFLRHARRHYGEAVEMVRLDAQRLPFADASLDAVLIVEAIYYLPDVPGFFAECRRVLRPGGHLLIVTTNKDLFGFHPSAHSRAYHGVVELNDLLSRAGFAASFFGDTPLGRVSARQRVLQPIKWLAVRLGLVPRSMAGKKLLRRLVFGSLRPMPFDLADEAGRAVAPAPIAADRPDRDHKILFCAARVAA